MQKTEFEIFVIGTPDTAALSESEQRTFFEALLKRIIELKEQKS